MNISKLSDLLQIKDIVAPELDKPNYGSNIEEQFKNIDENFQKLVGHDYFRGEKGDSVNLIEVNISDQPKLAKQIGQAIYNNFNEYGKELDPIETISGDKVYWYDNLKNKSEKMIVMYSNDKIISSLAYIYIDPRFQYLKQLPPSNYSQLVDCSSVVYFDKYIGDIPTFKVVSLFPTLYYDEELGQFCWKIWGSKSGIVVGGGSCSNGNGSSDIKYFTVRETNIIKI